MVGEVRRDGSSRALVSDGRILARARSGADGGLWVETDDHRAHASEDEAVFSIPRRFLHVDLEAWSRSEDELAELRTVLRRIHPDSTPVTSDESSPSMPSR